MPEKKRCSVRATYEADGKPIAPSILAALDLAEQYLALTELQKTIFTQAVLSERDPIFVRMTELAADGQIAAREWEEAYAKRNRQSSSETLAKRKEIFILRTEKNLSWAKLAKKFDMTEKGVREHFNAEVEARKPKLADECPHPAGFKPIKFPAKSGGGTN